MSHLRTRGPPKDCLIQRYHGLTSPRIRKGHEHNELLLKVVSATFLLVCFIV